LFYVSGVLNEKKVENPCARESVKTFLDSEGSNASFEVCCADSLAAQFLRELSIVTSKAMTMASAGVKWFSNAVIYHLKMILK